MSNPAAKHRLARPHLAAALACALAGAAVFLFFGSAAHGYVKSTSLFWWWISQWIDPDAETEHGWLILGISAWLFWRNLRIADRGLRIADRQNSQSEICNPKSALAALAAMVAGLGLHLVGFAAQQGRISIVALLVFTWGVLRFSGGRRWGAAALFPLGFMVFAIPFNGLDTAGFWLRMWVIEASARLAHFAGIGVLQSGTQLVGPDGRYNYDVAAACSGIRSLTAVAALSLLAGYLNFHTWWRRALVLLLCFPLVYLGNVARITAIVFAAQWGGTAWGDRAHAVMGYGVFVIVLGGLLGAVSALRRWWPEASAAGAAGKPAKRPAEVCHPLDDKPPDDFGGGERDCHPLDDKRSWIAAVVVLLIAGGEMMFLHHLANAPVRGAAGVLLAPDGRNPVELPAFLGTEWIGRRADVSAVEREILPPDTGFSRKNYVPVADPAHSVFLSIVLSGRDRTSIHRPELCLVGQGWTVTGASEHRFRFPPSAKADFSATVLQVQREVPTAGGKKVVSQLTAYWFIGGDTIVASHRQMFGHDAWNRVFHARADRWAYVLMQTDASDGEAAALARMQAVLDGTLPVFQKPGSGGP